MAQGPEAQELNRNGAAHRTSRRDDAAALTPQSPARGGELHHDPALRPLHLLPEMPDDQVALPGLCRLQRVGDLAACPAVKLTQRNAQLGIIYLPFRLLAGCLGRVAAWPGAATLYRSRPCSAAT